ncbi:MAG: ATP-binding protein [Desulforudis sp.]|jgi:ATP-binding protein involved in chromosome partitioning|nr:MAG: ATP-binding protein [Desulforudis sp.]
MVRETEIVELNVIEGCNKKCEDCERYFECDLPFKELFQTKGILSMIRENLQKVRYKVIVLGGKGGVGKSMLAVNLAAALAQRGRKVCVLDQVYDCPAIPMMLGVPADARLMIGDRGLISYESKWGIKVISTGLILDPDEVIIWFHDMKRNATEELLCSVDYEGIDYLVVDIPTGTSSETVNILKYMPDINASLVVTVPSGVSQNVARKCLYILKKAGIPITGVVENMSDTACPSCKTPVAIIQSGAGERMSKEEGVPFLGKIPVSLRVSTSLDDGEPFVIRYPDSEEAAAIQAVADAVIRQCEGALGTELK